MQKQVDVVQEFLGTLLIRCCQVLPDFISQKMQVSSVPLLVLTLVYSSSSALAGGIWTDEYRYEDEKCSSELPFLISRTPNSRPLPSGANNTKCDGSLVTDCLKTNPRWGTGLAQKTSCQTSLDAPFTIESSETYFRIDFYASSDSKCEADLKSRQLYLADEKCRVSGPGNTWSKVFCADQGGYILTCQDEQCKSNCTKMFESTPDTCTSNKAAQFKATCVALSGVPAGKTPSPGSSSDASSPATPIVSIAAFILVLLY